MYPWSFVKRAEVFIREAVQMQKLLNTLYITEPDASLRLKGEALSVVQKDGQKCHIPLHQLEQIVSFSYAPGLTRMWGFSMVNALENRPLPWI